MGNLSGQAAFSRVAEPILGIVWPILIFVVLRYGLPVPERITLRRLLVSSPFSDVARFQAKLLWPIYAGVFLDVAVFWDERLPVFLRVVVCGLVGLTTVVSVGIGFRRGGASGALGQRRRTTVSHPAEPEGYVKAFRELERGIIDDQRTAEGATPPRE